MVSPKNAVVFPGQGSQYPQMLSDYFSEIPDFITTFNLASNILNIDLIGLIQKGSKEELSKTEITQPLLLTSSYAIWLILKKKKIQIDLLAGHSLGEYSALVASEVITFEDALRLVQKRAELMQNAVPEGEGGIAAIIGLSANEISSICKKLTVSEKKLVSPANLNSSNQIVISGSKEEIDIAIDVCKKKGAKRAIPLSMSVPSHCQLMKPASVEFKNFIDLCEFNKPNIPVISNVNANVSTNVAEIKDNLIKQLYRPVRWQETMSYLLTEGISRTIECGPSKVLSGLIKRELKIDAVDTDSLKNIESI